EKGLVFPARDVAYRKRDARIWDIDDSVNPSDVKPGAGDTGADIRLVEMIAADDLDFHTLRSCAKILDRELCGHDRAGTGDVGVQTRHVGEDADFDSNIGSLRLGSG